MPARDDSMNEDMSTPRNDGGSDELAPTWTTDGHLDEGTIHAWIDDAFDPQSAAMVESHVDACSQCQGQVAEARGFVAGASRVVRGLDAVPAGVVPQEDVARTASRIVAAAADHTRVEARMARVHRPWYTQPVVRAAAALLITVGGGAYVLRGSGNNPRVSESLDSTRVDSSIAPSAPAASGAAASPAKSEPAAESLAPEAMKSTTVRRAPLSAPPAALRDMAQGTVGTAETDATSRARRTDVERATARSAEATRTNTTADSVSAARERRAGVADVAVVPPRAAEAAPPAAAVPLPTVAASSALQGKAAGMRVGPGAVGGSASGVSLRAPLGGGTIAGVVVDPRNAPLEGAAVSVSGTSLGTMTNAKGEFTLRAPADTATLLVRRLGYEPSRVALSLRGDDTTRAHVTLTASTLQLSAVVTQSAPAPRAFARDERVSACWVVKATDQVTSTNFALPRALQAGDLTSSAPEPGTWPDWPVAGASASVVFRRAAGGSLTASADSRGVRLVLVLMPMEQGWEGTATQTQNGSSSSQRVRLVSGNSSVCKP